MASIHWDSMRYDTDALNIWQLIPPGVLTWPSQFET